MFRLLSALFFVTSSLVVAEEKNQDIGKVSEAFGHLIGKNLETLGVDFDIDLVMKGLKEAGLGKKPPLSEAECIEAIAKAQAEAFQKQAKGNLEKAETFLKMNGQKKEVVTLEKGRLQYKVDQKGTGEAVKEHFSPVIRYVGKYLDGSIFDESKEGEVVALDESIPGFSKGLLGMKEGEKRTLYIHPEFGYGTRGFVPPNSLLTFEVEVVKANAPSNEKRDPLILDPQNAKLPDLDAPVVR